MVKLMFLSMQHRTIADSDAAVEFLKEKYMDKLSNVRRAEEGGAVSSVKMSDELKDNELVGLVAFAFLRGRA